jgi:hypothetical protein
LLFALYLLPLLAPPLLPEKFAQNIISGAWHIATHSGMARAGVEDNLAVASRVINIATIP